MQIRNLEDVQLLIKNKIEEDTTLEYKLEPGNGQRANNQIAKDISALANSDGGTIIYGIKSRDKKAESVNWLGDEGAEERIQSIAATAISPKLENVTVRRIPNPVDESKAVFIADIPRSLFGPHMTNGRYHMRRGSISLAMEDSEVRNAMFSTGRSRALRYEIAQNYKLAKDTYVLLDRLSQMRIEERQQIALIPLYRGAWDVIVASGVLFTLEDSVVEKLQEVYGLVHQINALIAWISEGNRLGVELLVAHTPAEPRSVTNGGFYLPAVIKTKLARLLNLLDQVVAGWPD